MTITARSYLTAGIAAFSAGAIALAPVQPLPNHTAPAHAKAVDNLAFTLAATVDPITAWVDTFTTSFENIQQLFNFYLEKPFPLLQTIGANLGTYFRELTNGQAALIPEQVWGNLQTFFQAPWDPGLTVDIAAPPAVPEPTEVAFGEYVSRTVPVTESGEPGNSPEFLQLAILQEFLTDATARPKCFNDGDCIFLPPASSIVNFLNNHYSGQVLGLLGPLLAPVVVLTRSFTAIGQYFQEGKVLEAVYELINIPANLTNGVLNGAGFLDLTAIVSNFVPLPVDKIGVNLGGLISPPVPSDGSLFNPADPPTEYSGGVGIDGVAATVRGAEFPGLPISWIGSAIGLGQFLSEEMLVVQPPTAATASAPAVPPAAAAAAVEAPPAPAVEAPPAPAVEAPPAPAPDAGVEPPAEDVVIADTAPIAEPAPAIDELTAAVDDPAPAAADTRAHRGGGNDKGDNGGKSSGRGHRGAA